MYTRAAQTTCRTCPGASGARRGLRAPLLLLALAVALAADRCALANDKVEREYAVKAAFLVNFAGYVEWPEGPPKNGEEALVIGVLGTDPFGAALDMLAEKKSQKGKKILLRRFNKLSEYAPCHILFVSSSEAGRLTSVLDKTNESNTLVVGDSEGLAHKGAAINFLVVENKVRFEVNLGAAKRAGLKISSKLLRLAKTVIEQNGDR